MMKLEVYTVRDDKAEAYLQPFYMQNESLAIRAMTDCITDANHQFAKHINDYSLYHLGTYSDSSGKFELNDSPKHLINLVDLRGEQDG